VNVPSIDKTLKLSLSEQIKQSVLNGIADGTLKHNSHLPYEEDIADFYHVSRSIVRKAYDELEEMGYITRIKRLGTRVKLLPSFFIPIESILQFPYLTSSKSNQIIQLNPKLVLRELLKPKHVIDQLKGIKTSWLREVTLFYNQNQPFMLCDAFYPSDMSDTKLNILTIHQIRNHIQHTHPDTNLNLNFDYRIVKASSFICTSLNLTNDAVVFHFNFKLSNADGHCITLLQIYGDASSIHLLDKGI